MEPNKRRLYWRLCYGTIIVLSMLTFSPLVIPSGTFRPMLGGIPYTLWVGIVLTVLTVVLTYGATQFYPVDDLSTDPSSDTNSPVNS